MEDNEEENTKGYSKANQPEKFYEQCAINYKRDKEAIEISRGILLDQGVPPKYIFVCQTNTHDKLGDIYPYNDTEMVEEQLNYIKNCKPPIRVWPRSTFRFICVDLRDSSSILNICDFYGIKRVIEEYLADIEGRRLEFDKEKDPERFREQKSNERIRASDMVSFQYTKLKKNSGTPDEYIFVAHTKRNDPLKRGELIPYTDKNRLQEAFKTIYKGTTVFYFPPDDIFTCLDICNVPEVRKYITPESVSDQELLQLVCNIKQLATPNSSIQTESL